jgi:predicted nucleotidyltransferase
MRIAAVICEYNPFHNGHKYQLDLARRDFDAVLCVMSGSFTQRGEVAVFDKWQRAKAATINGADLVLELGTRFSLSSASGFARGAVDTVLKTGIADALVFGSEAGDIKRLSDAADAMLFETPEISQKIKDSLSIGLSYPMARQAAFRGIIDDDLLTKPNNILALEYIMALKKAKSDVLPVTHGRTADFFSESEDGGFASASHIREKIKKGEDFSHLTPYDFSNLAIYDTNRLTDILKFSMIAKGDDFFADIPDAEQGLYNRLFKNIDKNSFDEIIDSAVTKRYTRARLKRTVLRALLDIRGEYREPQYLRVLSANEKGRKMLALIKENATAPIVTKVADFPKGIIEEDLRATDIASLCANIPQKTGKDFLTSPIMI